MTKDKLHAKIAEYRMALQENQQRLGSIEQARRDTLQNIERLNGAIGAVEELLESFDEKPAAEVIKDQPKPKSAGKD